jgi:ribonucleotide reductase beta subunit family protein with ferritin-like domain
MDKISEMNILSKSRMEQHLASIVSEVTPAHTTQKGSPARKPRTAKVEPPALNLESSAAAAASAEAGAILAPEPLLTANPRRHVLFPIEHPDIFAMTKKAIAVFWTVEEVDLTKDMKDWEKLDANTQHFIKHVLGFFAASDGILMENLSLNFQNEVQSPEARFFYANQNFMEAIHSEMYSLLIDTYIDDKTEKQKLLEAVSTMPAIQKKAEWAMKWLDATKANFATRLIAFAVVEGIFFSGSFCAIFWLKKQGLMPGLTTSNEFISRDEGMHTDFACLLYGKITNRLKKSQVNKIIKEAVTIEKNFITKALPCELIGMNSTLMSQYIEFVADRLVQQLGYPKIYSAANPFEFMERISLEGKDNFFEKRNANYAKAGVGKTQEEMSFSTEVDF